MDSLLPYGIRGHGEGRLGAGWARGASGASCLPRAAARQLLPHVCSLGRFIRQGPGSCLWLFWEQ